MIKDYSIEINGQTIHIEIGRVAKRRGQVGDDDGIRAIGDIDECHVHAVPGRVAQSFGQQVAEPVNADGEAAQFGAPG